MVKGRPRIDAIELVSFKVDPGPIIHTRVNFVDTEEGIVHASVVSTETNVLAEWSPDTLDAVKALHTLIERDIAQVHLYDTVSNVRGLSVQEGGLGEYLSEEPDACSV